MGIACIQLLNAGRNFHGKSFKKNDVTNLQPMKNSCTIFFIQKEKVSKGELNGKYLMIGNVNKITKTLLVKKIFVFIVLLIPFSLVVAQRNVDLDKYNFSVQFRTLPSMHIDST